MDVIGNLFYGLFHSALMQQHLLFADLLQHQEF